MADINMVNRNTIELEKKQQIIRKRFTYSIQKEYLQIKVKQGKKC